MQKIGLGRKGLKVPGNEVVKVCVCHGTLSTGLSSRAMLTSFVILLPIVTNDRTLIQKHQTLGQVHQTCWNVPIQPKPLKQEAEEPGYIVQRTKYHFISSFNHSNN